MKIIKNKKEIQKALFNEKSISLIPTMGGLHKGHISLLKKAKKYTKKIVVSIFINPKQFNSKADYKAYPRNFNNDIKILKKLKVKYLFVPKFKDIFSFKTKNKIYLHPFSKKLCGKYRPGHFKGVINVVNRFLELIKPKYIFLGKKDFQQLFLIKKHITKNKIKTSVISCNTVREKNLLPYSSRNYNLNKTNKILALKVLKYLRNEKIMIKKNRIKKINLSHMKKKIINFGIKKIDYLEAINLNNLRKAKKYNENFNIFFAFYVGNVRLIDNF